MKTKRCIFLIRARCTFMDFAYSAKFIRYYR